MKNNLSSTLGTIGVVYGLYFAMKNNKQIGETALYAIGFGLVGALVGNAIKNSYEK